MSQPSSQKQHATYELLQLYLGHLFVHHATYCSTHSSSTMDIPRPNKSKNKEKQVDYNREPNWTVEETTHLLNAVKQIQDDRHRNGFSFTSVEKHQIYNLFKASLPGTTRDEEKLINRLRVLFKMFKVCHKFANRSGGGWDDETHRPIAPSEDEYVEMIRVTGAQGKFLLRTNFPWYRQLQGMVGGQAARGEVQWRNFTPQEPIHALLGTQMSIQGSEQGSSDEPDDGMQKDVSSDPVPPPVMGIRPSYVRGGQGSDSSVPNTENCGWKRKSTDESSGPSSKGKRYKERCRKKKAEQDQLVDAGFELARKIGASTDLKLTVSEEEDKCLQRFDEWGIVGRYHDYCMSWMHQNYRRKWFLNNDKHTVVEWIERNIGASMPYPNPSPTNSAPNQTFAFPNPAAFNYSSFFPNH